MVSQKLLPDNKIGGDIYARATERCAIRRRRKSAGNKSEELAKGYSGSC